MKENGFFNTLKNTTKEVIQMYLQNDISVYAGHASFLLVIASFPFLTLIISMLNNLPQYRPTDLIEMLYSILPDIPEVQGLVADMVFNLKRQSSSYVTWISLLLTLFFASNGVYAIQTGLKKVTFKATKRAWDRLIALAYTISFAILVPIFLFMNVASESLIVFEEKIGNMIGISSYSNGILEVFQLSMWIANGVMFILILLTYTYLPGKVKGVSLKDNIPGSLFTSILWFIIAKLFSTLILRFYKGSVLYGSLAALFLLVMWLRIMVNVLYIGQSINTILLTKHTSEPLTT